MIGRLPAVAIVASLVLAPLLVAQTPRAPVPIFVTSVGAVNGHTDPNKDNQDSAEDLKGAIKDHKELALASTPEAAAIVIVVQNREKAQETASWIGNARDCTVRVKFVYHGDQSDMSASAAGGTLSSGGAWKKAAGKLIGQVADWVKANIK